MLKGFFLINSNFFLSKLKLALFKKIYIRESSFKNKVISLMQYNLIFLTLYTLFSINLRPND